MARTEGSIRIEAPPEEVMAVITDFETYPSWAGMRTAEVLETDEEGRPQQVAFELEASGMQATYTLALDYPADHLGLAWVSTEAGGVVRHVEGAYRLEASGDGTEVTYDLTVEPAIPLPGFLRRRAERAIVSTALEGLKRRVEEGGSGA
ncbi:MAG TPA: SRPBCC family protein [Actinomycetota bacterium]|nr:SRPBCC family protein [Actinomycetota bacterium]